MQLHNLKQGTDAWHQFRLQHFGASEAAAMLGISPTTTRTELLHTKHTGIAKEFSDFVQARVLDKGHEVEALARPIVEEMIGDDLYPATVSSGKLSASCDGLTMSRKKAFEHKQWSKNLAALVKEGVVPDYHMAQCQQILLVTRAEEVIFTVSDGTRDNFLTVTVRPDDAWFERIERGWEQFEQDLAEFTPEAKAAPVVAAPVETLPAVRVQVDGALAIVSNLPSFGLALRNFIDKIPTQPNTDQEFADTDAACKALKKAEEALDAAEANALAQLADVDTMRRLVADFKALARTTRLQREKLVAQRKEAIKLEIVTDGGKALAKYIAELNAAMPANLMPAVPADFGGVIKGLKSVDSIKDAVSTELARAKIAASDVANRIHANVKTLAESSLVVHDTATLVLKAPEDLAAVIAQRQAAEKALEEAQRERIRKEEAERLERQAEENKAKVVVPAPAPVDAPLPAIDENIFAESVQSAFATPTLGNTLAEQQTFDSGTTRKLGEINELFGFTMTADFLLELGFKSIESGGRAKLYRESDIPKIGNAIIAHIEAVTLPVSASA